MTCCSTESSFLERRCSAITLGLSSLAPLSRASSSSRRASRDTSFDHETHQQFPGIHIIEATPKSSPCPSERQSHLTCRDGMDHMKIFGRFKRRKHEDNSIDSISEYPDEVTQATSNGECEPVTDNDVVVVNSNSNNQQNHHHRRNSKKLMSSNNNNHLDDDISHNKSNTNNNNNNNENGNNNNNNNGERRAPLASLSSFKMSSAECADSMELDANGSVFDDASCADTDDDMEQFSTDSDEISLQSPPSTDQHVPSGGSTGGSTVKCDNSVILLKSGEKTLRDSSKAEDIERQKNDKTKMSTIRPVNYLMTSNKSSECVATVDYNNEKYSLLKPSTPTSTSSAVILEMPMLAKQDIEQPSQTHHDSDTHRLLDPAIDLSLTIDDDEKCAVGTSNRKWSKETLF